MTSATFTEDEDIDKFKNDSFSLEISTAPQILYHYSSADTFLKIIENKSVWATHFKYLNDSTEIRHGMDLFEEKLNDLQTDIPGVTPRWNEILLKFIKTNKEDDSLGFYIFCMSEDRDLLSQWRGYGDGGAGLSIGFSKSIDHAIEKEKETVLLIKVIYEDDLKSKIVDNIYGKFCDLIITLIEGNKIKEEGIINHLTLAYLQTSLLQSLRFKHFSWHEEKEWRIVSVNLKNKGTLVRARGSEIVKYHNLVFSNIENVLSEVVIGPRSDKKLQRQALDSIKNLNKLNFSIRESIIPFK